MPEFVRPFRRTKTPKVAVIDFDGTLSLLRAGWVEIMVDIMLEVLRPLPGPHQSEQELVDFISDFVLDMTGKATIFQMEYFVNVAKERGGNPNSAEYYTQQFLIALNAKSDDRAAKLEAEQIDVEDLLIPGTVQFLSDLKERGVRLTLASGTPGRIVRHEAKLLKIDHFFEGRIYGPEENSRAFSKLDVMRSELAETGATGEELLGVGDGFVEIVHAKELGGVAVGCATDEVKRSGRVENWKRTRLIRAGADIIIPDYRPWPQLAEVLFAA